MKNLLSSQRHFILLIFIIMPQILPAQDATTIMPYYFYEDENEVKHYILDKALAHYAFGSDTDLIEYPLGLSITYYNSQLLTFALDKAWNRFVYGSYGDQWIKVYGIYSTDSNGWNHPRRVAQDGSLQNPGVYVTDTNNGRIVKLIYDSDDKALDPNSFTTFGETTLERPWALDIDDRGNSNPADDWLWVIDKSLEKVLLFTASGQFLDEITSLYNPSTRQTYNDLSGLSGIAIRKDCAQGFNSTSRFRLYLTDWKLRKIFLVNADIDHRQGEIEKEVGPHTEAYVLTDIESDYYGDIWVVSSNNNSVHKRTWDLKYLDQWFDFDQPWSVASSRLHPTYIAMSENWTNSTGIRTYTHGAESRMSTVSTSTTTANFNFNTLTYGRLWVRVYRGSTLKATLHDQIRPSGPVSLNWYQSNPEYGPYTLKILAYAHHDNNIYHRINYLFSFKLSVSITGPSVLDYKESGTWTANATGGYGSGISYQWYRKYVGSSTWYPVGSNPSLTLKMYTQGFTVKVRVTRGSETVEATKPVEFGGMRKMIGETVAETLPEEYDLVACYPNPFNPSTTIRYNLPEVSDTRLIIYDLSGREILTWSTSNESAGYKQVNWYGQDQSGRFVASGLYIYRLDAKSNESDKFFMKTMKMVLLK